MKWRSSSDHGRTDEWQQQLQIQDKEDAELLQAFMDDPAPVDRPVLDVKIERDMEDQRRRDKQDKPPRKTGTVRRVAAGILIFCGVGFGGLVATHALGLPFLDWFLTHLPGYSRTNTNVDLDGLRDAGFLYGPAWLPDGFVIDGWTGKDVLLTYSEITFYNADSGQFGFLDHTDEKLTTGYDRDHDGVRVFVGDYEGYLTSSEGFTILYWQDGTNAFLLGLPDDVDVLRVAENIIFL